MGDKLFLNFGAKLRLSAKMALKFFLNNVMNGDVRAAKDALENRKILKKDNLKMDSNRCFVEKFRNLST